MGTKQRYGIPLGTKSSQERKKIDGIHPTRVEPATVHLLCATSPEHHLKKQVKQLQQPANFHRRWEPARTFCQGGPVQPQVGGPTQFFLKIILLFASLQISSNGGKNRSEVKSPPAVPNTAGDFFFVEGGCPMSQNHFWAACNAPSGDEVSIKKSKETGGILL